MIKSQRKFHARKCYRARTLMTERSTQMELIMIRKLKSGKYRLYSKKKNPKTGKRRNLGTFKTRTAAKKHEKDVQYFKRR